MEDDILRIPAILYSDLYTKSINGYDCEVAREDAKQFIIEHGVEKSVDFPDKLNRVIFEWFEISGYEDDTDEMRNTHGCIHV